MKNVILALLFVTANAFGIQVFNSSDVNLGNFSKVKCSTNLSCSQSSGKLAVSVSSAPALTGNVTMTGSFSGDGGDALYGFLQKQVASTTTSATIAQCGSTFVSDSADVITLPEASTALGCRYTFVCGTADDFDVNPADGTDQILPVSTTNGSTAVVTLSPSAGDAIRCTDAGGSITLEAVGANAWAQVGGGNGIWTDVN
jgi:hypothetical protein